MPLALPLAIKIDSYCEVLNINNDLGVFSIPRQASGTKNPVRRRAPPPHPPEQTEFIIDKP